MSGFAEAYAFVRQWEGGDSAPRPGDPNPTSRGLTQRKYDELAASFGWERKPVYDLAEGEVQAAYLAIWNHALCGQLPSPLGWVHFDAVVNCGPERAVKLLQSAAGVEADGAFGPKTAKAIAAADARTLAVAGLNMRDRFYQDLANRTPEKRRFLRGWLNRTAALRKAAGLMGA